MGKGKEVAISHLIGLDGTREVLCSLLSVYPCIMLGNSDYSDWVWQSVKEIYLFLGISCVGHEKQFMALLSVIEESRPLEDSTSLS